MNEKKLMNRAADNIRILAASMVEKANSGHPGGAMGGADFVNVLFSEFLVYDPENPRWEGRDRFFLDPGHMSPMLYSTLALTGKFTMEELAQFRQWGSPTPGHPEVDIMRGIENTSGPLGQGHTFAVGAAIAAKFLKARLGHVMDQTIYAYISDGGIQEEISQGAGRLAGHLGLDNLIMFYDSNDIQLSTATDAVTSEDVAKKYEAWHWKVITIDGNDPDAIRTALTEAKAVTGQPTLIIGKTIMGKGARKADDSSYERNCATHGAPLGGDAYINTIKNLGGDPTNPFQIFPEVKELYAKRAEELKKIVAEKYAAKAEWTKANPELAAKLELWFSGKAPKVNWNVIEQKAGDATRSASAKVLGVLATEVENMIVSSADLSNSDKTDGFLKKTHAFTKDDFTGAFLQAGVSELTMACCCLGMALHGGVIAACATFFVFSDYVKAAVRLSALQGLPVTYVFTHDSIAVGEDGPTHEPIEHLAGLRAIPNLNVYRPADARETQAAWYQAVTSKSTPTALVLTRQNLTVEEGTDFDKVSRGAYVVHETAADFDTILLASGSEVNLAVASAKALESEGYKVRVVSVPSTDVFDAQDQAYKEEVLPNAVRRRVAIEMAASLPWYKYVGLDGAVIGIDTFGASAPAAKIIEEYGFTVENIVEKVKGMN